MNWNFVNNTNKDYVTGYEDILDKLKEYTKDRYLPLDEEGRKKMVDEVFEIYRSKNIFPIQYYNEKGIAKEIQKCIDRDVEFKDNILGFKLNQGSSLCRYMFPNLFKVECKGANNNGLYHRFMDDHKLKRAIDFALRFKKSVTPSEIRGSIEMIGGNFATQFPTMKAKALYEKYVPKDGIIYDYSCGWGNRLLGALSSKNNYTYIGIEPCKETYTHLHELGERIEKVTGRENSYRILQQCSEDFNLKKPYFHFAFSSPPYFSLEKYSDEETQCYNKYPTLEEWFDGYVRPTIQNIHDMLKEGCYYGVNINDFNLGKEKVEYVEKWLEISKEVGFEFVEKIEFGLQTRTGNGFKEGDVQKKRSEGIYIFKK